MRRALAAACLVALSGCSRGFAGPAADVSVAPSTGALATSALGVLVTPPVSTATTTCGVNELWAATTAGYRYLVDCASDTLLPAPTVSVAVGAVLEIGGYAVSSIGLSVPPGQSVVRLEGDRVTGLAPGTTVVTVTHWYCGSHGASQPVSCPLLRVVVG